MHRDILEWEWYQHPTISRLYFHLLLKVNYTDKKWQGILVKRGQLITSTKHLAIELNLSIQKIRTAQQKLQDSGDIKVHTTNRYTLITIVDYDKTQTSRVINNKPIVAPVTTKKQRANNQLTTTKERNKGNKYNKTIEERRHEFKNEVFAHSQIKPKILESFYNYWSELNTDKTQMRKETETFFEVAKRLKKWIVNERPHRSTVESKPKLLTNR